MTAARLKHGKMYVVNTKPADHSGEHWIVIDWTKKHPYMFDSFGKTPKFYRLPKIAYWKRHLQHPDADTCGVYCAYYVVHRERQQSPDYMFQNYTRDKRNNDRRIMKWFKSRLKHL